MSLAQNITIMNRFINTSYSSGGSTPARFVENYMARNNATLTNYPVDEENFSSISANNPNSVFQKQSNLLLSRRQTFNLNRPSNKDWFDLTTLEGRAFSENGVSLSKNMIKQEANYMQKAFNEGHTVLTIVSSFDNDYLKHLGVEKKHPLDFTKDVDEMKLRLAEKKGCQALSNSLGYTEPLYIGSIQLDRDHPHAHITMCETAKRDKSNAKFFYDGHEWGILNKSNRSDMRQAINNCLEREQSLVFFPSNATIQAQHEEENYCEHYATLKQQKQLILANAITNEPNPTSREKRAQEAIIDDLSDGLSMKCHQKKQKIRQSIKEHIYHNDEKENHALPPLLNLQLQSIHALRHSRLRSAKLTAKLKKIAKERKLARLKELKIIHEYHMLITLSANYPEKAYIIKAHIMPYFQQALRVASLNTDNITKMSFRPVKDIPVSAINDFNSLKSDINSAKTPFQKQEARERALDVTENWHQEGYISSHDLMNNIESHELPLPVGYPDLNTKRNLAQEKDKEIRLAKDASHYIDQLPTYGNDYQGQIIKDEFKKEHQDLYQKREEKVDKKPLKSQTIMPKQKQLHPNIKHYRSINYQQADDDLLDSLG